MPLTFRAPAAEPEINQAIEAKGAHIKAGNMKAESSSTKGSGSIKQTIRREKGEVIEVGDFSASRRSP